MRLKKPSPQERLTPKELETLKLMADGLKNKEIADELGTSEHVVKNLARYIYDKIGMDNRVEAAMWYIKHHEPREISKLKSKWERPKRKKKMASVTVDKQQEFKIQDLERFVCSRCRQTFFRLKGHQLSGLYCEDCNAKNEANISRHTATPYADAGCQ